MTSTPLPEPTSPSAESAPGATASSGRAVARRTFAGWLDTIDPDIRQVIVDPRSWFGVTVLALIVIIVGGVVPGARGFFQLRALPALLIFLPTPSLGLTIGLLERRGRLTLSAFGLWCLIGSFLFQTFMWSLVALSQLPGAALLASLPILLAAYHGHVFRSAPETPYIAVGTTLSILMGLFLNHDAAHIAIYTVAGPVAIGSALILGRHAVRNHWSRLQGIALREAIDAQILIERARHVELVSDALGRMHGTSHDAGNALSAALFNLEQLVVETRRRPLTDERCDRIGAMANDLLSSLGRLRLLLEDARVTARDSRPVLERVDVGSCVREVFQQVLLRYPGVRLRLNLLTPTMEHITVPICGGASSLQRILTNLAINACEGNGSAGARNVDVTMLADTQDGLLMVTIADDGPGFSDAMLAAPFRGFHTTKAGGTGLGLYTAERLVRASGGTLTIANAEDAPGGRVHLGLRR